MENETVDYGKMPGMVPPSNRKFWCSGQAGIPFIVFLQGCQMRCQCYQIKILGQQTNKSRERTVDDVLEEALPLSWILGGERGESLSVVEKPSCRLMPSSPQGSKLGIHFGYLCLHFRNTPRYLEKIWPLDGSNRLGASGYQRNQWWTA